MHFSRGARIIVAFALSVVAVGSFASVFTWASSQSDCCTVCLGQGGAICTCDDGCSRGCVNFNTMCATSYCAGAGVWCCLCKVPPQ